MYPFKKEERLCSKILIEKLFSEGKTFVCYPFKINYFFIVQKQNVPLQLLISVSKRNFKSAVKRNYIKRQIRESYRINKDKICNTLMNGNLNLLISLTYINKEISDSSIIQEKVKKLMVMLEEVIQKNIPSHE
jgi:ribonuclease P protein component